MADIEKVGPTRPVWPKRRDEHPPGKPRHEEPKEDQESNEPRNDDDGDAEEHVDVFASD